MTIKYDSHFDGDPVSANHIFVFGSNLAGIHGAGAAYRASRDFGAIHGHGIGHNGDSYAIPTKGKTIETLPLYEIRASVIDFCTYARDFEKKFWLTRIGCGLAGYTDSEIAPLFEGAPANINMPFSWLKYL